MNNNNMWPFLLPTPGPFPGVPLVQAGMGGWVVLQKNGRTQTSTDNGSDHWQQENLKRQQTSVKFVVPSPIASTLSNNLLASPGAQDYNPSPLNSCASGSAPRSIAPTWSNYKYHCRALPGQLCMNGAPRQGNALGAAVFAQPGVVQLPWPALTWPDVADNKSQHVASAR